MSKSVYPELGIARPGPPKRKNLMPDGYLLTPQAPSISSPLSHVLGSAKSAQNPVPPTPGSLTSTLPLKNQKPPYPYLKPNLGKSSAKWAGPSSFSRPSSGTGTVGELGRSKRERHTHFLFVPRRPVDLGM